MEEKILKAKSGMTMMILFIVVYLAAIAALVAGCIMVGTTDAGIPVIIAASLYLCAGWIFFCGLKVIKPQEALVLTLFGKYIGTLKGEGFYYVNPFVVGVNPAAKTSLRQSGDVEESKKFLTAP